MLPTIAQNVKAPALDHPIHPLLQKRWSPLAFSEKALTQAQMSSFFEAARWAASANNEQPWQYVYALRGTEGFQPIWQGLLAGNQVWAGSAAALVVSLYRKTFKRNGNPNPWAMHDVGMANAQLVLQAADQDVYTHMMAGFDRAILRDTLNLGDDVDIMAVMGMGYLGDPSALPEKYQAREQSERSRLSTQEFTKAL